MTDDELIERMAKAMLAAFNSHRGSPLAWDSLHPVRRDEWRQEATALLPLLNDIFPGLSDVIDGKAVIVPVEATPEMVSAFWRQKNAGTQEIGIERADHRDDFSAYAAMINARPK